MDDLDGLLGELGGPPPDDFWAQLEGEAEPSFTPEARANIEANMSKRYTIMPTKAQLQQVLSAPKQEDYNIAVSDSDLTYLSDTKEPIDRLLEEASSQINRFFDGLYQATNFTVKHDLEMKKRNGTVFLICSRFPPKTHGRVDRQLEGQRLGRCRASC